MKYTLKKEGEIALMRESAILVSKALAEVGRHIVPGVDTLTLDEIAEQYIRDNGGVPAFKNYSPDSDHAPFPYTLCVSLNEAVVHGLPSRHTILKHGDIVSVDCGVKMKGYFGDSAYTFTVGEVKPDVQRLLQTTKESLYKGIQYAVEGMRLGDISFAIQSYVEARGYSVVREMVGHGIGTHLHEAPEVPNYGKRGDGLKLKAGMVLAIEPMINIGGKDVRRSTDGWTVVTADKSTSAHYEHTVVVRRGAPEILTSFDFIEQLAVAV